ncbi:DUF4190 domain-containing protein [Arthrobacter sp. TMN-37]
MSNYPLQGTAGKNYQETPGEGAGARRPAGGRTLGIVGLILAFLISPVGLIISIIAMVRARIEGTRTGTALAGIIVGLIGTVLLVIGAFVVASLVPDFVQLTEQCQGLGSGTTVEVRGAEVQCP